MVVGLLALAAGVSVATPPIAGAVFQAALGRSLRASDVRVGVGVWPPTAAWGGRVDVLTVAARRLKLGTLDVDAFTAALRDVRFDPQALYLDHVLVIRSLGSGIARVTVSEASLAGLLAGQPSLSDVSVGLEPGRVSVGATIWAMGASLRATGDGRLVLRGDAAVDLVFDRISVAGPAGAVILPGAVAGEVTRSMNPILDVRSLPFGLRLTGLTVGRGQATLDAAVGAE